MEQPDLHAILQEAHADTKAKRYEAALKKHVWFHENALSIDPEFSAVRLSFALADWYRLAQQYPPAMAKLKQYRDAAQRNVLAGEDVFASFHEMASINRYLGEDVKTLEVFKTLDANDAKSAKIVFGVAEPSLVKFKAYELAGKYLSPERDMQLISEAYRHGRELSEDPRFGNDRLDFAERLFQNKSTTLVALLVINDRQKEAEEIADAFRNEWDDEKFHAALDEALKGIVPEPWP